MQTCGSDRPPVAFSMRANLIMNFLIDSATPAAVEANRLPLQHRRLDVPAS
jgi:hypothetical protein